MNKFSIIIRPVVGRPYSCVASCYITSRYLTLFFQRRARVSLWMGDHDQSRTIAHAKLESAETGDILPDEWPRKVGIVTSTLLPRVPESWIFYVSWTGHDVGWHDGTPHDGAPLAHGTTSVQYIHYYMSLNLISFLEIQFPTISHTKSTTSPNRFQSHNVAGALPYVPILGTSGSLANMQSTTKKRSFSSIGLKTVMF